MEAAQLDLCCFCFTLDAKMDTRCVSFTLSQQFIPKYKPPGNDKSDEDLLRTCESTPPFLSNA